MKYIGEPHLAQQSSRIYDFKTILLVDDDRQLAESLQWILADENFLVDVAHDGDEAMLKIATTVYDAIVCDIMMPRLRGDEFYRQATEMRPELGSRFIFITGFGKNPEVHGFLNQSALKCLIKPFPVKKLIDCVRELLDASASSGGSRIDRGSVF